MPYSSSLSSASLVQEILQRLIRGKPRNLYLDMQGDVMSSEVGAVRNGNLT